MDLPRVYELAASLKGARKSYFRNFTASIRDHPLKRERFVEIEAELATLDAAAWEHLKASVGPLFLKNETARDWKGASSALNEAKAYNYLVRRGCTSVTFIPRRVDVQTPDLRARMGSLDVLCEAKTINRSQRAISPAFFTKLASTVRRADRQMAAFSSQPNVKRIAYLVIDFASAMQDDVDDYLRQIQERREEFAVPGLEIILDVKARTLVVMP